MFSEPSSGGTHPWYGVESEKLGLDIRDAGFFLFEIFILYFSWLVFFVQDKGQKRKSIRRPLIILALAATAWPDISRAW